MKLHNKMFVSIATFFVFVAASFAEQVKTDYDHSANFGQYKTYSWEKVQTKDPLMVERIKDAVNAPRRRKSNHERSSYNDRYKMTPPGGSLQLRDAVHPGRRFSFEERDMNRLKSAHKDKRHEETNDASDERFIRGSASSFLARFGS